MLSSLTAMTGLGFLSVKGFRAARHLYNQAQSSVNLSSVYGQNSWVVITGGAGDIGLAHAQVLAKKWSFNLILVDSDDVELQKAKESFSSEVHTIKANLTSADPKIFEKVWKECKKRDVSILLNSVSPVSSGSLTTKTAPQTTQETQNTLFPTLYMTKFAMADFAKRKQRCMIVNVQSPDTMDSQTQNAQYDANSHMLHNFSENLQHPNIDFHSVTIPRSDNLTKDGSLNPEVVEASIKMWGSENWRIVGSPDQQILADIVPVKDIPESVSNRIGNNPVRDFMQKIAKYRKSS